MISDDKVLDNLIKKGLYHDPILKSNIKDVLNRPRHLDSVPKTIGLQSVKNIEICGCAKEFKVLYNSNYIPEKAGVSHIELNGMKKDCDYVVYVALKSLIMLGINKNEQRALACRELFLGILKSGNSYISTEDMFRTVINIDEYYGKTIGEALIDCCFEEDEKTRLYEKYTAIVQRRK